MMKPSTASLDNTDNVELRRQIRVLCSWLTPRAFERCMYLLLTRLGYQEITSVRAGRRYGGSDIKGFVYGPVAETLTLVQLKQYGPIQRRFVDELRGAMLRLHAPHGLVITTAHFSEAAVRVADSYPGRPVELIDGDRLARLMIGNKLGVRVPPLSSRRQNGLIADELFFDLLEEGQR